MSINLIMTLVESRRNNSNIYYSVKWDSKAKIKNITKKNYYEGKKCKFNKSSILLKC